MNSVDLYKLSVKNGLKMSYIDWCGTAMKANLVLNGNNAPGASAARANANFDVATLGSLLVLSPCDLGLPDMLAPGSQYQGVFRFDITVNSNYQNDYGTPNAGAVVPDICCVCVESEILITDFPFDAGTRPEEKKKRESLEVTWGNPPVEPRSRRAGVG